jgi:hypothetical protein
MENLRNAHHLARLVLVWFALFLGVAIASPIVNPQSSQLVCSASGMVKLTPTNGDANAAVVGHAMDCPLCAGIGAPPPISLVIFDHVQPLAYAMQSIASARIATATSAPLPARGPPSLL